MLRCKSSAQLTVKSQPSLCSPRLRKRLRSPAGGGTQRPPASGLLWGMCRWPGPTSVVCVGSAQLAGLCTGPGPGGPAGCSFTHRCLPYRVYFVCSQSPLLAFKQACPWNVNQTQISIDIPAWARGLNSGVIPRAEDPALLPAARGTDLEGAEGGSKPTSCLLQPTPVSVQGHCQVWFAHQGGILQSLGC